MHNKTKGTCTGSICGMSDKIHEGHEHHRLSSDIQCTYVGGGKKGSGNETNPLRLVLSKQHVQM